LTNIARCHFQPVSRLRILHFHIFDYFAATEKAAASSIGIFSYAEACYRRGFVGATPPASRRQPSGLRRRAAAKLASQLAAAALGHTPADRPAASASAAAEAGYDMAGCRRLRFRQPLAS